MSNEFFEGFALEELIKLRDLFVLSSRDEKNEFHIRKLYEEGALIMDCIHSLAYRADKRLEENNDPADYWKDHKEELDR